jgi:SecD/SecF fusion protein
MFTALFMTRYYFAGWIQHPKNKTLSMANWITAKKIDFLKWTQPSFAIAALIILVGGFFVVHHRATLFGMDFTGGYSLNLEFKGDQKSYIADVEQALIAAGAHAQDFQVRELDPSSHVRLLFSANMDAEGKPFHENAPIGWIKHALDAKQLSLAQESVSQLDANWTAMSGQMSDSMRNNALIGLLISLICIFIYLAFRFEYPFAMAATLCLLHDVLITVGLVGLLHACNIPVQIDLNTVAAIMTIVGYSLNDTIIIFDRIREEMFLHSNRPLPVLVNQALNATLSRTAITSGTTLLVLLALVILGGASIFSFSLVMTLGVFFGTLSSWTIASPLLLYFHRKHHSPSPQPAVVLIDE